MPVNVSSNSLRLRNVSLPSLACPLCDHVLEDSSHLFFGCSMAKDIQKLICRWWNLDVHPYESYEDWLSWFNSIRLGGSLVSPKMFSMVYWKYYANVRRTVADFSHAPLNEYSPSPDDKKQWSLGEGKPISETLQKGVYEERKNRFLACCMDWGEVNPVHAYYNGSRTSKDNERSGWEYKF
ncbi:hypothetical protein Tco_0770433 [Tanacetum coccineum]|uniref:Reverse transcriptase zinc-binding domain-containing protein n=1 Tax=Tanacetum coccineum TaxID=301880 RepID=A0ABQ4ZD88_9ASTR